MSQASQLSPELARGLLQLARALLAAARNWTLYPPEHPTVAASVSRLSDAIRQSTLGAIFSIGITPETLMVESTPADSSQSSIAEAAALLHDRDLLRITFIGDVPPEAVHALLRVLSLDPAERRRRGGPAVIWAAEAQPTLVLEQIDYQKVLSREEGDVPEPARRDELWQSIVTSIAGGQTAVFDELAQERLLAIAGSPSDIGALASAVVAPKCAMDGSPMITSQAATVLAAYRHLAGIVSVMSPDRVPEVMNNLATASLQLDPHVVMQVLQTEEDPKSALSIVKGLGAAFDDAKVAQLLATALALEGQASDRLATIFNTIAPDEDRRRRVMTLTRSLLSETDFGKAGQFQTLWSSMEELLVSYNDKPFVSETYRAALDGVGGRAERMAIVELPPEITEWLASLGQENVRGLSVQLLIDLLTIEEDGPRAAEIARDMEALSEDLLMAGAYDDTQQVTQALAARATAKAAVGRDACRQALDQLGESIAMRETASIIGDIDEKAWKAVHSIITTVGPSSIEALRPMVGRGNRGRRLDTRLGDHRRVRETGDLTPRAPDRRLAVVRSACWSDSARHHWIGGSRPAAATAAPEERPARHAGRRWRARQGRRPVGGARHPDRAAGSHRLHPPRGCRRACRGSRPPRRPDAGAHRRGKRAARQRSRRRARNDRRARDRGQRSGRPDAGGPGAPATVVWRKEAADDQGTVRGRDGDDWRREGRGGPERCRTDRRSRVEEDRRG